MKKIALAGCLMYALGLGAQNLVINGSFEEIVKKPKEPGQIHLAEPWVSGTQSAPDLYSRSAKSDLIRVPENAYGDEEPKDGDNYAGILIYSDREKEARSYLTAQLKHKMLAGEDYCIRFYVSFADMSKFASNNIGLYVSHDSIGNENDLILNFKPQIIHSTNRIFERQWSWEPICRIYRADGGEQFIAIGNFGSQEGTQTKPVKRPSGYTKPQLRDGYYFIDMVSVEPNATPKNCKCEKGNFAFANLDKEEQSFETDNSDVPETKFIGSTDREDATGNDGGAASASAKANEIISFSPGKSTIEGGASTKANNVVKYLKENPGSKVKLTGHVDKAEASISGLADKRITAVVKHLRLKGIDQERIETENVEDTQPLDTSGLKENRGKNMVVEVRYTK